MRLIPLHSLVLMIGSNHDRQSQTIHHKFQPHEILSCKKVAEEIYGLGCDETRYANLLPEVYRRAELKLSVGERVVIDVPYLQYKDRIAAVNIGNKFGSPVFYLVPQGESQEKAKMLRGDSVTNVIDTDIDEFHPVKKIPYKNFIDGLINEGYRGICVVPDVHGMVESLKQAIDWSKARGLFMVFLGDIIDYGPQSIDCVYLVYDLVMRSQAVMTIGNHERKIQRWLDQQRKLVYNPHALAGKTQMRLSDANKATTMTITNMTPGERAKFEGRFNALLTHARHHWVMGDLMFVHGAGEPEMYDLDMMRLHGRLESRALYGEIDPKVPTRPDGYPNRIYEWVNRIPEGKMVLVGHDIRSTTKPLCIEGINGGTAYFMDTGSGKGGRLTTADIFFKDGNLNVQNFTAH